ncbi:hypothetical protein [Caulobacter rhizosphaerae]|jgi:hypothetical protein|uniref:SnoaL-like protein n=1 Tax=Caulobacter rhizosphaerae TaxID=2010972 RepID=A0ABU1N6R5_9CAUL|nr:hypothetical protein [Caulobacter rhizosphaerae]MDR6534058.1 hypothetical protein [Caulobacter rhizosphaerae]GGL45381.1 hypothetical protein GCM10010983_48330 [Caulobacter rhizosphaerae]
MLLALGAALAMAGAAPVDVYPIGTVEPSCKPAMNFTPRGTMTRALGCLFDAFAATDPKSPTFEADLRKNWIRKVGRARVQGASEELLSQWSNDPRSAMFSRADFTPLRFENMNMQILGNGNFVFTGDLISEEGSQIVRHPLSGEYTIFRGSWMMIRFKIDEAK